MKILLTGATGTLGSVVLQKLLSAKDETQIYCLVKSKYGEQPESRIKNLPKNAVIIPGDITKQLADVSSENLALIRRVDAALHCAASIDFGLSKAANTAETNINGTRNVIELAAKIKAKNFYHVSTSYVAGDTEYFSENDLQVNQNLRNPYEKTKFAGEQLVRMLCAQASMPYTIFRPSVIVGDSKYGSIASFEGYYGFFKYIVMLRDRALDQAQNKSKNNHLGQLVNNGIVSLPLTIRCSFSSTINLVPIDWIVDAIQYFLKKRATNVVYHLVNERPPPVRWVIDKTLEILKVKCAVKDIADNTKTSFPDKNTARIAETMQKGFEATENLYWPYITREPKFSLKKIQEDMGVDYVSAPYIDERLLKILLRYAEQERWGRAKNGALLV